MLLTGILLLFSLLASTPPPVDPTSPSDTTRPPFLVFTGDGAPSSLEAILDAMATADMAFVGESHDDSVAHALEAGLLQQAFARYAVGDTPRPVVLALEMFERDVQLVLDEYLDGLVRERDFLAASRPWANYTADYRPLVEFARIHKIPVVASNAPARYVSRVGREGPESLTALSESARTLVAPLGFAPASEAYAENFRKVMQEMMAAAMRNASKADSASADSTAARGMPADSVHTPPRAADSTGTPSPHGTRFTLDAQNLRDATMAFSLTETLRRVPGALVLHVNGSFHSNFGLGTPEQARRLQPEARHLVIAILSEGYPEFDSGTMKDAGDFIILTDPGISGHETE